MKTSKFKHGDRVIFTSEDQVKTIIGIIKEHSTGYFYNIECYSGHITTRIAERSLRAA